MNEPKSIYLAHDNHRVRESLAEQLTIHNDFLVEQSDSDNGIEEVLRNSYFDVVLCGGAVAHVSSSALFSATIGDKGGIPIVLIAENLRELDDIRENSDKDWDVLLAPFHLEELFGKILEKIGERERNYNKAFYIGPYTFEPALKSLMRTEESASEIRLTDKETAILEYLCRKKNTSVPREVLLKKVWGYNDEVTTHTLETHVYRIRQKMEVDSSTVELLVSELGGYRLKI